MKTATFIRKGRSILANPYTLPPGPRGLPFLGNLFQMSRDQLGFLSEVQRKYGRMATIHIGRTPVVVLFEPEHVRYVLTENPRNFTNREVAGGLVFGKMMLFSLLSRTFSNKVANEMRELVGDGIITTDGEYHERQRRLLQPAFSKRRIENYSSMIVEYAREMLDGWRPGMEVDLATEFQTLILRVMVKILLDLDIIKAVPNSGEIIHRVFSHPVSMIEGLLNLPIDLPFTAYGKRRGGMRAWNAIADEVIERRLADNHDVGDILSILLSAEDEAGRKMTKKEVRDELVALTAAGHETTTNTLVWTMYLLSEHPHVFAKVQAELQMVLGGRLPNLGDLPQLPYLDQVIKESMRLYPSGWVQGRHAVNDFELDGYHFPAGTLLMFNQWVLHRRPDLWEDAEQFVPERWDPDHGQKAVRWAYFPFGGGSRVCLGQSLSQLEVHLVLAMTLQRYYPRVLPSHVVEPLPLLTLRSRGGMPVRLEAVDEGLVRAPDHLGTRTRVEIGDAAGECPFPHHLAGSRQVLDDK
jgi:cytochrome P450